MRVSLENPAPVSVIIPCWRCAETIERAVASVAAQSWVPAEVILIDDASGDDTLPRLHEIAQNHPQDWIKIISLPKNAGPGIARNAGWEAATQPYIAFLDADDAWHPQKIELQIKWMVENPEVVLSGHTTISLAVSLPPVAADSLIQSPVEGLAPPIPATLTAMLIANRFHTRSVVLRRTLPLRFHGKDFAEDYLLWLQTVADGHLCVHFDTALAYSFRPEFSAGGYSGFLWQQEKRELRAIHLLHKTGRLPPLKFCVFSLWSLIKYLRRVWIAGRRQPSHDLS
jgi:glycosyltransferase involved in cell wall biosynthesis